MGKEENFFISAEETQTSRPFYITVYVIYRWFGPDRNKRI
jgi:hypothetical protein